MRWVSLRDGERGERAGVLVEGAVHAAEPGIRLLDLLAAGDLAEVGTRLLEQPDAVVREWDRADMMSPVPRPPSVRDFYAFEQHVRTARQRRGLEMDPDWYQLPVFYFSNPVAVKGPYQDVAVPPGSSQLDFELEVAAVVGRGGADLQPDQAEEHIAGFCVMND